MNVLKKLEILNRCGFGVIFNDIHQVFWPIYIENDNNQLCWWDDPEEIDEFQTLYLKDFSSLEYVIETMYRTLIPIWLEKELLAGGKPSRLQKFKLWSALDGR